MKAGPQKKGTAAKAVPGARAVPAKKAVGAQAEAGPWRVPGYVHEREQDGAGGTGHVVVRARHKAGGGTPVTITYLSAELAADEQFREAFRGEADALSGLDSPYLARLYAYVEDGPHAAVVREPVEGVGLDALLTEKGMPAGPEPALAVLKGSLLGLAAAYGAGVVHGGYRTANVLVTAQGTVRLTDVGLTARTAEPADVQAATAAFHACLTGSATYARVPVPESVQPLIALGLAADPAEPPPSPADFAAEVEAVATAAYGEDWEARGQHELVALVAPLLPPPVEVAAAAQEPPPPPVAPPVIVPAEEPPARARFGRRAKFLVLAAAVVVVAGALTVTAVATGNNDDAAATVTPTASATLAAGSASSPAPAPTTATPSASATSSATSPADPSTTAPHTTAPATTTAPTTRAPQPPAPADPTKSARPAFGPHVSSVSTDPACHRHAHTATAVVTVAYDGTAGGTLHLTWWRSATGKPQGATAQTPQDVKLPKGPTSYTFTSNFSFKDNPGHPYVGVTVSTDPAAATGNSSSTVVCS